MSRIVFACLAVLFVASVEGRRHRRSANDKIEEVVNGMIQSYINGDFESIAPHYDDNARLISDNGKVFEGKEAIIESMKAKKRNSAATVTAGTMTVEKVVSSGDLTATVSTATLTVKKDEQEMTKKLRKLSVFKKVDDSFKILIDGWFRGNGESTRVKRETMREKITAMHKSVVDLMGSGNADSVKEAMTKAYQEDVTYITPEGGTVEGRENVMAHFLSKMATASNLETQVDDVIEGEGIAIEIGLTKFLTKHGDHEMQHSMRHAAVWKIMDDGTMQVAIDAMFAGDGEHVHPMGGARVRRQADDSDDDSGEDDDESENMLF